MFTGGLVGETNRPNRLEGVYGARDSRQTTELYDGWAAEYERDVLSYGYTTPAILSGSWVVTWLQRKDRYSTPGRARG